MRLAVAAIARPTFDVDFAAEVAAAAVSELETAGHELVGDATLLMDADAVAAAATGWDDVDGVAVLQATFADSTLVMAIAAETTAPLHLWAFPEERSGDRLRLNSLCGINLAGYALTAAGHDYTWAYGPPAPETVAELVAAPPPPLEPPEIPEITSEHRRRAAYAIDMFKRARIGVIGDHPEGFEPCAFNDARLRRLGPAADRIRLEELFSAADAAAPDAVAGLRWRAEGTFGRLNHLAQDALDQSLRIAAGLQHLTLEREWSAVATRCWPECFTEFGGAVCSPHAMLGEDGVPGMCEADTYGAATALLLHWLTAGPVFVADLVELAGDTGVFWHCGNAPTTMAGTSPVPTIHSNRRKPLLGEFVLKPGVMTLCRLSQSNNDQRIVVGLVEAIEAPLPFSGTSAVVRFQQPILPTVMAEGLEHHYGLAYGDVRAELQVVADELGIEVLGL